jgi:HSP20 family protein
MAEKSSKSLTRPERPGELDPFESGFFTSGWRLPRLFDELFASQAARPARWSPALDVAEDEGKYVITLELPGCSKDDVHVEVQDDVMTIRGEKRSEREEKKEQRRWVERSYGSFSRSFTLPANAVAERVNASFKDGVLTVELPKGEAAKPKAIPVR